jgi:hypothetical protein
MSMMDYKLQLSSLATAFPVPLQIVQYLHEGALSNTLNMMLLAGSNQHFFMFTMLIAECFSKKLGFFDFIFLQNICT